MAQRICSVDGCERTVLGRGLCSSHYSVWHRRMNGRPDHHRVCEECGQTFATKRTFTRFCSTACAGEARRLTCFLPDDHPVMARITEARTPPQAKPQPFSEIRACLWCDGAFTATRQTKVYCSSDHKRRAKRVRRRGTEYGWTSNYTWAEVMRVWLKFDKRCAYCEQPVDGLPEPDHVIPLSKGGCNSITNILPCCALCNSDKRDLLLGDWNADRERRGLPSRITSWPHMDQRIVHLTSLVDHLVA